MDEREPRKGQAYRRSRCAVMPRSMIFSRHYKLQNESQAKQSRTEINLAYNFEYCGEHLLREKTYFWRNTIPTKNGLLIPAGHPDNPNNDPGLVQFQIFKLHPSPANFRT